MTTGGEAGAGVVDAHTHVLLPPRVATRVRGFFEAHGYDALAYPLDPSVVLSRLADDGVTEAWSLPYAHRPGTARDFNAHSAAAAARTDGPVRVIPGGTVHPGHPATAAVVEVMRAHDNVHADLTPVLMSPVAVAAADLESLADRFLFGSDAPNTGLAAGEALARLDALGLSPAARAAIVGGTARRLVPS